MCKMFFILRRTQRDTIKSVCIGLHVKCPLCLSDFNSAWTFRAHFEKCSNIKFRTYLSSGSRVAPFGHTDGRTDRRTNVTKIIVFFAILRTSLKSKWSLLWRDMPWSVSYLFRKLPTQDLRVFNIRLWLTVTATTSRTAVTTAPRIELGTRTWW